MGVPALHFNNKIGGAAVPGRPELGGHGGPPHRCSQGRAGVWQNNGVAKRELENEQRKEFPPPEGRIEEETGGQCPPWISHLLNHALIPG